MHRRHRSSLQRSSCLPSSSWCAVLCPPHPADALQLAATQVPRAQVVTALSGYSTAIMTMQYYAAKILRERAHPDRLRGPSDSYPALLKSWLDAHFPGCDGGARLQMRVDVADRTLEHEQQQQLQAEHTVGEV